MRAHNSRSIRARLLVAAVPLLFLCSPVPPVRVAHAAPQAGAEGGFTNRSSAQSATGAAALRKALSNAARCAALLVDDIAIAVADAMISGGIGIDQALEVLDSAARECPKAGQAARALRQGGYRTAPQIKAHYSRKHAIDDYGKPGTLSHKAYEVRKTKNIGPSQNIVVVEHTFKGERHVKAFVNARDHSEIIAMRKIPPKAVVSRLYSERNPCADCWQALRQDKRFENATQEYAIRTAAEQQYPDEFAAFQQRIVALGSRGSVGDIEDAFGGLLGR